jgi:hypothetical protein
VVCDFCHAHLEVNKGAFESPKLELIHDDARSQLEVRFGRLLLLPLPLPLLLLLLLLLLLPLLPLLLLLLLLLPPPPPPLLLRWWWWCEVEHKVRVGSWGAREQHMGLRWGARDEGW